MELSKCKSKRLNASPAEFFKHWAFDVDSHYWEIMGLFYGQWLDIEKAKPLREVRQKELISEGLSEKEARSKATKSVQPKIKGWAETKINIDDFSEGYSFHQKDGSLQIQIHGFDGDMVFLLFFDKKKLTYSLLVVCRFKDFISFLETGIPNGFEDYSPQKLRESNLKYLLIKSLAP
jgi:hypothetical protein